MSRRPNRKTIARLCILDRSNAIGGLLDASNEARLPGDIHEYVVGYWKDYVADWHDRLGEDRRNFYNLSPEHQASRVRDWRRKRPEFDHNLRWGLRQEGLEETAEPRGLTHRLWRNELELRREAEQEQLAKVDAWDREYDAAAGRALLRIEQRVAAGEQRRHVEGEEWTAVRERVGRRPRLSGAEPPLIEPEDGQVPVPRDVDLAKPLRVTWVPWE